MELSANISYEALHGAPPACEPERQQYFMEKQRSSWRFLRIVWAVL